MRPVLRDRECMWVGWIGTSNEHLEPFMAEGIRNVPVTLSLSDIKMFYEGLSNRALWPLYHDAVRPPEYRSEWWNRYVEINRRYAEVVAEAASDDAVVWVHDYQLQLVPQMVRELKPGVRIGFFLHIPFPPQELFAQIPWRTELLRGMMGADVVGFQTKVGASNFVQACKRFADAEGSTDRLNADGRDVRVGCFPISIDFDHFEQMALTAAVAARCEEIRARLGRSRKIFLGIDRMDYTKGIDIRLQAYRQMLKSGAASRDKCVLIQVAVPSREHVQDYKELRTNVEQLVGAINGEFGDIGRTPVQYLHHSITAVDLTALYTAADVMLVTPLRDGMNLVSKEYVASRVDNNGVLVLSEFTGASKELRSALLVNPHDIEGVVSAMSQALQMRPEEQKTRMRSMRRTVKRNDVYAWARKFLGALEHAHVG
jgi:trehalose 6-phosphate synthase